MPVNAIQDALRPGASELLQWRWINFEHQAEFGREICGKRTDFGASDAARTTSELRDCAGRSVVLRAALLPSVLRREMVTELAGI
jgi:hypothetical protein